MDKHTILHDVFGYNDFRQGQEIVIDSILSKKDTLCVMPTGGGKSICFQLPALLLDGLTIVVSPLISLMKDQVNTLERFGVNAAFLNSTLNNNEYRQTLKKLRDSDYKIIYVAPERLAMADFISICKQIKISMIAVDEAHCISMWGQSFRPTYRSIFKFINQLPVRPIISAFTATATPEIRKDIVNMLGMISPTEIVTGFDRPNLYFSKKKTTHKTRVLLRFLRANKDKCGIVYCSTHKYTEDVCALLNQHGYAATLYHAGLSGKERKQNQEQFASGKKKIIVATNAFGLGIDKADISFVIHYNMPKSIEGYYQEAGRAGRDGNPAKCLLLHNKEDIRINQYLIHNSKHNPYLSEKEEMKIIDNNMHKLQRVVEYCNLKSCLRAYILDYFGEMHSDMCYYCECCKFNGSKLGRIIKFLNS